MPKKKESEKMESMNGRETIALINLQHLIYNFREIKRIRGKAKVLCVVKANAYGHGIKEISRTLERAGAEWFGVATLEEAEVLLKNDIKGKILVLNGPFPGEEEVIVRYDLRVVAFDIAHMERLNLAGKKAGKKVLVHIKIDTGMGRLGFLPQEFIKVMKRMAKYEFVKVEGIMSHFAHADLKEVDFIKEQIKVFKECIRKTGFSGIKHIANSAGTILIPSSRLDMVRTGIALYGVYPSSECEGKINLKPVLSLKTRIHSIKKLPKGYGISYGHTYRLKRESTVAIIPIGYGDGFLRANSNKGKVLVKGNLCPVIGSVCMDLTAVDVTEVKDAKVGDEVVIIGEQNGKSITAHDLARSSGTIPYEVLTILTERVKRIFLDSSHCGC